MSKADEREAKIKEWVRDPSLRDWARARSEELVDDLDEDDPLRELLSKLKSKGNPKAKAV